MTAKEDLRINYSARSCENCAHFVLMYKIPPESLPLLLHSPVTPVETHACDWGGERVECSPSEVCGRWAPIRGELDDLEL